MRKVIYSLSVSLDGFIEGPGHDIEWHIIDEEWHRYINDQERNTGAHLYGRRMYETMQYWQTAPVGPSTQPWELEYAEIWRRMPKVVFSRTLPGVEGNARLVRDDVAAEVTRLKEQPGNDMIVAGASLAASFMKLGLVDEIKFYVNPIILGGGTPALPAAGNRFNMQLVGTRTFRCGVVLLHYQLSH